MGIDRLLKCLVQVNSLQSVLSLIQIFQLGEHEMVWCGMAMGHPDWSSAMNNYRTERAPLDEVVDLRGF